MKNFPRVCVIEDNDTLRGATLRVLEQAGFDACGFSCAEDVDDTPHAHETDVYVIDLNLPGEDGLSLTARLRRVQPNMIVIITTARTHLNDRVKGYESGANIYMPKPVDPQELVAALNSLILQRRLLALSAVNLQLDPQKRSLFGPAGEVRLTDAEVRILRALANAKEQTLERWQINVQVKSDDQEITADNLQNRLSQLRKKMQSCGIEGESIRPIRGLGYQLAVNITLVNVQ